MKSPGAGWTFAVGTANLSQLANVEYSNFPQSVDLPPGGTGVFTQPDKQVVILQATENDAIRWQRFFYGFPENSTRATNVRGISVWAVANGDGSLNQDGTRIAICGEHTGTELPLDQTTVFNEAVWKGFVAVYNGGGVLLWTHHFFQEFSGIGTSGEGCVITDVSVRVDNGTDIVTYCGAATFDGSFASPVTTARSVQPLPAGLVFAAPAAATACTGDPRSGGSASNGGNQWDGFVGRLTFVTSTGARAHVFHDVVGGQRQDVLLGIDEIDENRFVVVGVTGQSSVAIPSGFGLEFPFTTQVCTNQPNDYSLGVAMLFDASTMPPQLEWSQHIGADPALGMQSCPNPNTPRHTTARDVVVQRRWNPDPNFSGIENLILVAGSTNECALWTDMGVPPTGQPTFGGGIDGFVLGIRDQASTHLLDWGTFRGGSGNEGLTGIQAWNEYVDHFCVVGFVGGGFAGPLLASGDIEAGSYWIDTASGALAVLPLRAAVLGSTSSHLPALAGALNAIDGIGSSPQAPFDAFGLGRPGGGGITVDPSARVNVVGGTSGSAFYPLSGANARSPVGVDGYRGVLDMLPDGVGRTDGTSAWTAPFLFPLPNPAGGVFFGGTTPECALSPFGRRIGQPLPPLPRMLIEYEGPEPGLALPPSSLTVTPSILIVRPPETAGISFGALQFDFPGFNPAVPPAPAFFSPQNFGGMLNWMTNSPVVIATPGPASLLRSIRFQLSALPAFSTTISAQFFCALSGPVPGGNLGPTCPGAPSTFTVASPALWISY